MNSFFPLYCDFRNAADSRVVWTRASAAQRFSINGAWRQTPASTPRLHHTDSGLPLGVLLELQRTNSIRNSRGEGAVAGSPGTYPTFWGVNTDNGLTRTVVGTGTEFGHPYIDVRWNGVTLGGFIGLVPDGSVSASPGQTWTGSYFARIVGGSAAGVLGARIAIIVRDAALGVLPTLTAATVPLSSTRTRFVATGTLTEPTSASVQARLDILTGIGAAVDITLRFYAPQLELGAFATTPIFAAVGSPAVTTRAGDSAATLLRDFGVSNAGPGVLLVAFRAAPGISGAQPIASISDNTADNRVLITREAGRTIRAEVFAAGVSQGSVTSVATVSDNADAVVAVRFAVGDLAMSLNGAEPVTAAPVSIPASMTQLDLLAHNGPTARSGFRPTSGTAPTNADLQTLSRQGPFA